MKHSPGLAFVLDGCGFAGDAERHIGMRVDGQARLDLVERHNKGKFLVAGKPFFAGRMLEIWYEWRVSLGAENLHSLRKFRDDPFAIQP